MEYTANSLFKKGYKNKHLQILGHFGVCYIIFPLMAIFNYEKYNSFDSKVITSFILAITLIGGNIATISTIKLFNRIVNKMIISNSEITIITINLFSKKLKQVILQKDRISISKRTFPWEEKRMIPHGVIIRDKKTRTEYYIVEAYFDEYDDLVEQLKQ